MSVSAWRPLRCRGRAYGDAHASRLDKLEWLRCGGITVARVGVEAPVEAAGDVVGVIGQELCQFILPELVKPDVLAAPFPEHHRWRMVAQVVGGEAGPLRAACACGMCTRHMYGARHAVLAPAQAARVQHEAMMQR